MIEAPIQVNNSGLVFYCDTFNSKSYAGEPTTNLIPSPTSNAYPTYGNGWGTYNTNQYNGGNYFSIGTISSVSSNIVTTAAAHPLRTYDVVQPQTSGGGLTAGQVYFVKKLSNTTFCLYAYNGSQDGSQGYINTSTGNHKVYDSIMLDQKISINSTSFPTMWWGPPHVPNSGLVKEIIPGGFDVNPSAKTDCVRLHYIRTDGAYDGMSYNVDASVTIGSPVTTSFWTRAVTSNAVGATVSFQHYNYGGVSGADGFYYSPTLGPLGVWEKKSFTFTPTRNTLISYWFFGTGNAKYDIANIQIEQKNRATQFVAGSRSNTQGLLDLVGASTIDLAGAGYSAASEISLDGSANYFTSTSLSLGSNFTIISWVKPTAISGDYAVVGTDANGCDNWLGINGNKAYALITQSTDVNNVAFSGANNLINNAWNQLSLTVDGSVAKLYLNKNLEATYTAGFTIGAWNGTFSFGRRCPSVGQRYFGGQIGVVQMYNRVLTQTEISKNFDSLRSRYNV